MGKEKRMMELKELLFVAILCFTAGYIVAII